jgi:Tol biopolymer transport system component
VTHGTDRYGEGRSDEGPTFSPDGRFLAYSEYDSSDDSNQIVERDLTTGATRTLVRSTSTTETDVVRFPDYSPDGSQLLFTGDGPSLAQDVFLIPRAGGPWRPLTHNRSSA